MDQKINIVGLGGSLRSPSTSLTAVEKALEGARKLGAETRLLDIRTLDLPMYKPGRSVSHAGVDELVNTTAEAHAMIWCSPLYHGSVSGSFKNTIDWLELIRNNGQGYLSNKVIGLISTAGGTQGLQAINTMEFIVRALRGWAVPMVVPIAQSWKVFDENGELHDEAMSESLENLGREVYSAAQQFVKTGTCDYAKEEPKNESNH